VAALLVHVFEACAAASLRWRRSWRRRTPRTARWRPAGAT
jgi:hypothetical protein